jgi:ABC-type cobalt transport system substrate-binding protein
MPRDEINYVALVMLVESNFVEFEEYAGGEGQAMETLNKLRQMAGMGPAE